MHVGEEEGSVCGSHRNYMHASCPGFHPLHSDLLSSAVGMQEGRCAHTQQAHPPTHPPTRTHLNQHAGQLGELEHERGAHLRLGEYCGGRGGGGGGAGAAGESFTARRFTTLPDNAGRHSPDSSSSTVAAAAASGATSVVLRVQAQGAPHARRALRVRVQQQLAVRLGEAAQALQGRAQPVMVGGVGGSEGGTGGSTRVCLTRSASKLCWAGRTRMSSSPPHHWLAHRPLPPPPTPLPAPTSAHCPRRPGRPPAARPPAPAPAPCTPAAGTPTAPRAAR